MCVTSSSNRSRQVESLWEEGGNSSGANSDSEGVERIKDKNKGMRLIEQLQEGAEEKKEGAEWHGPHRDRVWPLIIFCLEPEGRLSRGCGWSL